jgi:hypothetical protein
MNIDEKKENVTIPDVNSDWGTIAAFALTFNGYNYINGGPLELSYFCDSIVNAGMNNASLDELRACLFFLQRVGRFCGDEGSDYDLEEARELLALMKEKQFI